VCLSATAWVTRMYAALRVASHVDYRRVCLSVYMSLLAEYWFLPLHALACETFRRLLLNVDVVEYCSCWLWLSRCETWQRNVEIMVITNKFVWSGYNWCISLELARTRMCEVCRITTKIRVIFPKKNILLFCFSTSNFCFFDCQYLNFFEILTNNIDYYMLYFFRGIETK